MSPEIFVAVLATFPGCVACMNESTTDIDRAQSPYLYDNGPQLNAADSIKFPEEG